MEKAREKQIRRLAQKYKMIVSSDPANIQRFLRRNSDADGSMAESNVDLDRYDVNKFHRLMDKCSQEEYKLNRQLMTRTYEYIFKLCEAQNLYLNVVPTLILKRRVAHVLFNDPQHGFIRAERNEVFSGKQLAGLISDLSVPGAKSAAGSESARIRIRVLDISPDTEASKEYSGPEQLAEELFRSAPKAHVYIVQPVIKEDSVVRGAFVPPKAKLFRVRYTKPGGSSEEDENEQQEPQVNMIKEGRFPVLEEQCKHLFNVLQVRMFNPVNLRLEGLAIDFWESDGVFYVLRVNSFRSAILDPNCVFVEERRPAGKRCNGIFCQLQVPLADLVNTIKRVRRCEAARCEYTLLRRDVADYDRLFKFVRSNSSMTPSQCLLYPFFAESILAPGSKGGNIESRDENELPDFQPVPVCETCYYLYLLYKSKREKSRLPNLAMKKALEMLSTRPFEEWTGEEREKFVLSCDAKHNPELSEPVYAEILPKKKPPARPLRVPRRISSVQQKAKPQGDIRDRIAELASAVERFKQSLAGGLQRPTVTTLPRITSNFVKDNIKKAANPIRKQLRHRSDMQMQAQSQTNLQTERKSQDWDAPKINEFHTIKTLYTNVLKQIRIRATRK